MVSYNSLTFPTNLSVSLPLRSLPWTPPPPFGNPIEIDITEAGSGGPLWLDDHRKSVGYIDDFFYNWVFKISLRFTQNLIKVYWGQTHLLNTTIDFRPLLEEGDDSKPSKVILEAQKQRLIIWLITPISGRKYMGIWGEIYTLKSYTRTHTYKRHLVSSASNDQIPGMTFHWTPD